MCKTMTISALAFLAGGMVGAMVFNQRGTAQENFTNPFLQDRAPQPPARNDDEPRRPERRRDNDAPQPPRGEGQPGRPGMMMGGPIQLSATGKFVYILRGNEILQFHAETLEFVKRANVPPPERREPREDGDRRERRDPPPPPRDPDGN